MQLSNKHRIAQIRWLEHLGERKKKGVSAFERVHSCGACLLYMLPQCRGGQARTTLTPEILSIYNIEYDTRCNMRPPRLAGALDKVTVQGGWEMTNCMRWIVILRQNKSLVVRETHCCHPSHSLLHILVMLSLSHPPSCFKAATTPRTNPACILLFFFLHCMHFSCGHPAMEVCARPFC